MGMLTRPYARLYGIENGITIDDCVMQTVWSTHLLRRLLRMPIDAGNACALRHSFFAPYDGVNQQVQRVRHSPISAPLGSPPALRVGYESTPCTGRNFHRSPQESQASRHFRMYRLHPRHASAAQLTANSPCRLIYTSVQCIACERGRLHIGNGTADIEGLGGNRCGKLVLLCERSGYRACRGLARTPIERRKSQYDSSCAQWQGMLRDLRARQQ